jgi:hypothetical protein
VGLHRPAPAGTAIHRFPGQDADHPDGAGEPSLGAQENPGELARLGHAIIAYDFLVVEMVLLKRLYVLVFTGHGTRRLHLARGDRAPNRRMAVQQARSLAMGLGDRLGTLRFLIHDRDPVFTAAFGRCSRPRDCGSSPHCRGCRG